MNSRPDENSQELTTPEAEPSPSGDKAQRGNNGLLTVSLVLSISALLACTVIYYLVPDTRTINPLLEQTSRQLAALEQTARKLETRQDQQEQVLVDLSRQHDLFSSGLDALQQQNESDNLDWMLKEIEQLLIIASHKLALEADVASALAAMQAVDNRLRQAAGQQLLELRKQLASDMNVLRSVNQADIPGMSIYLADIVSRVDSLPLQQPDIAAQDSSDNILKESTATTSPWWARFLDTIWQELKGLVVISTDSNKAAYALLPEQRYFLYQNLGLQLQIARLFMLRRDTENFRQSIEIINKWLQSYFDQADSSVNNIMESLALMAQTELAPVIPDINASLASVRAIMDNRTREDHTLPAPGP
jgi:uroporphyrin-3 C-methyltransferase